MKCETGAILKIKKIQSSKTMHQRQILFTEDKGKNTNVEIKWVKSHSNFDGNE